MTETMGQVMAAADRQNMGIFQYFLFHQVPIIVGWTEVAWNEVYLGFL